MLFRSRDTEVPETIFQDAPVLTRLGEAANSFFESKKCVPVSNFACVCTSQEDAKGDRVQTVVWIWNHVL